MGTELWSPLALACLYGTRTKGSQRPGSGHTGLRGPLWSARPEPVSLRGPLLASHKKTGSAGAELVGLRRALQVSLVAERALPNSGHTGLRVLCPWVPVGLCELWAPWRPLVSMDPATQRSGTLISVGPRPVRTKCINHRWSLRVLLVLHNGFSATSLGAHWTPWGR